MHQPIIPPDAQVERYQIRVQGQLDPAWSEWLGGLQITWDGDGNSVLPGSVADQTALHGVVARVRDLGLPLLALRRLVTPTSARREGGKEVPGSEA